MADRQPRLRQREFGIRQQRYPTPAQVRWVSIGQIASELGCSVPAAEAAIKAHGGIYPRITTGRYKAEDLERLKASLDLPHRAIDHTGDWLTDYEKGTST